MTHLWQRMRERERLETETDCTLAQLPRFTQSYLLLMHCLSFSLSCSRAQCVTRSRLHFVMGFFSNSPSSGCLGGFWWCSPPNAQMVNRLEALLLQERHNNRRFWLRNSWEQQDRLIWVINIRNLCHQLGWCNVVSYTNITTVIWISCS